MLPSNRSGFHFAKTYIVSILLEGDLNPRPDDVLLKRFYKIVLHSIFWKSRASRVEVNESSMA